MTVTPPTPFKVQKPMLATCSLTGCFGCHMSLLDIDERILELADLVELDVSPLDDKKAFDRHQRRGARHAQHRGPARVPGGGLPARRLA
jgi:hypothetical protein